MDNTNTPKKTKDFIKEAYKNFLHLSYLAGIILLVQIFMAIKGSVSINIFYAILVTLSGIIWYYIAHLFKKRDNSATKIAYIVLGAQLLLMILSGINIMGLFILYLFYVVYRAKQQKVV